MFNPEDDPDGEMLEFLIGHHYQVRQPAKVVDFNFRELCAFETPPDFSLLVPFPPNVESTQLLAATAGFGSGRLPEPADSTQLKDFRLENEDYAFISVLFLTTTEPFVGVYVLQQNYNHEFRMMNYEDLIKKESGVHFTPMPELRAWISRSTDSTLGVGNSSARERRLARLTAASASESSSVGVQS
jgi:hypothetical protein